MRSRRSGEALASGTTGGHMQISTIEYGAAALVGAAIGIGSAIASHSVDEAAMDAYDAGTRDHYPTPTSTKIGTIAGVVGVGGGLVIGTGAIIANLGTAMTGGSNYLSLRPY